MKPYTYILMLMMMVAGVSHADEYEEAISLIMEGKYGVAETLLNASIEKQGDSVKARYALGYCAEKQDRRRDAYDHYRKAVAINLATGEDPETTKRVYERLFGIAPRIKPVIEKAWMLESDAAKAETKSERDYLNAAAKVLYEFALQGVESDVAERPPVGDEITTADMEKALGYRLRLHRVGAKKFDGNGHYYMDFEEKVTWVQAQARCKEMGGYLATLTSNAEIQEVSALITTEGHYWLGGVAQENSIAWNTKETGNVSPTHVSGEYPTIHSNGNMYGLSVNSGKVIIGFICEWND